ncbi:MAG: gamma-glutamylcyclotransferase [Bacteroidetes bacterium]|nr:gamma-glutamylcyclotransferase [Bacteroidota bacterium]
MQEDCEHLFTYGTLRDGNVNHKAHFLKQHAVLIGRAYIHASLYKVTWYPAINLEENDEKKVFGEVYHLPVAAREFILHELDGYEGIYTSNEESEEYERVPVKAHLEDGSFINCWVYNYKIQLNDSKRIESGDYLNYLESRE